MNEVDSDDLSKGILELGAYQLRLSQVVGKVNDYLAKHPHISEIRIISEDVLEIDHSLNYSSINIALLSKRIVVTQKV